MVVLFVASTVSVVLIALTMAVGLYFKYVRHRLVVEMVLVVLPENGHENVRRKPLVVAHLSDFHCDFGLEERTDAILSRRFWKHLMRFGRT
jgi:predicted MPP superfamily phosphohydrolase